MLKEVTLWQQPCLIISFFSLQRLLRLRPNGEFSFSVSLRITYQWDFCCSRTSWPGTWSKEKFLCISPWHLPAWTWGKSSPPHLRYGEKFFIYTKHYTKIVCWIFLSVFFKNFFIFILTGRSSGLLGTSSWPVPRSSFNSVWSVRQSQRSAHAPSAGNASIQPTISYFNTWFTDVVWDGDWLGQKGRGIKSVTVEGAFRCHIQGKILGIIKQFETYQ